MIKLDQLVSPGFDLHKWVWTQFNLSPANLLKLIGLIRAGYVELIDLIRAGYVSEAAPNDPFGAPRCFN